MIATNWTKVSYILTASLAVFLCFIWLHGVHKDGFFVAGAVMAPYFCVVFALATLGAGWFAKNKYLVPLLTIVVMVFLSTTGVVKGLPAYSTTEPFGLVWLFPVFACITGILVGGAILFIVRGVIFRKIKCPNCKQKTLLSKVILSSEKEKTCSHCQRGMRLTVAWSKLAAFAFGVGALSRSLENLFLFFHLLGARSQQESCEGCSLS